jgi:uncharacterized protein (TIGR01777 family)
LNSKNVLITGASGLIGTRLTELLLQRGYDVRHLSRTEGDTRIQTFMWDVDSDWIESGALSGVDSIIHLAGAGVADEPWTENRKQEIIDSRVKSAALLRRELGESKHVVNTFISASGIGYYGNSEEKIFTEDDEPGDDFLANVTHLWEQEVEKINTLGVRVVEVRTGIVLSKEGGALAEFVKPIRWYVGAPLGSGNQWMSWIHIDDLCLMYIHAIENNSLHGPYNAVAPNAVTNRVFTKTLAKILHKPLILPAIPTFALKFLLGEMVTMVVEGSRVSPAKIQQTGFDFKFEKLDEALRDLFDQSTQVSSEGDNA